MDLLAFTASTVFELHDGTSPRDVPVLDPLSLILEEKAWTHSIYWHTEELIGALRDSLGQLDQSDGGSKRRCRDETRSFDLNAYTDPDDWIEVPRLRRPGKSSTHAKAGKAATGREARFVVRDDAQEPAPPETPSGPKRYLNAEIRDRVSLGQPFDLTVQIASKGLKVAMGQGSGVVNVGAAKLAITFTGGELTSWATVPKVSLCRRQATRSNCCSNLGRESRA